LYVLLAEDNLLNQKVMVLMLKKMGHRVDLAYNGLDVLRYMESSCYDVILMDIHMPGMDGITATKEVRRRWPLGPKIIAVTTYDRAGGREMCLEAGMDDFLSKPAKIEDLRAALKRVLP
jgi:CheY-like chemotaxis protein